MNATDIGPRMHYVQETQPFEIGQAAASCVPTRVPVQESVE